MAIVCCAAPAVKLPLTDINVNYPGVHDGACGRITTVILERTRK